MHRIVTLIVIVLLVSLSLLAQSPTATIDGRVLDPAKAVIEGATIHAINVDTNVQYTTQTNSAGLFTVVNLPPGNYRIEASKPGFRTIVNPGVVLHVQDVVALNFDMPVGSILESVTVTSGASLVNTEDASVSTVVDRNFAENLPMNGRSFQTLIQLTPGVVSAAYNFQDNGQFSVNGQRAESNYWMVDGVGANVGIGTDKQSTGNGLGGAAAGFSVLGGTNSLVSVDAMEEFRIQTSTFAPEFGRTPGGQVSIVTRAGTNQWHGSAFDYLRNDVLDANNWFADAERLAKPQERQNDFGGTLSGPILKDRTFFFFSYEGLRLRLPQVAESLVPDLSARQSAVPAMQPYLNAFPLATPGTPDDIATGIAHFNASYSNSATLDAYSLRIDHRVGNKVSLFARYNYSPSESNERGRGTLNSLTPSQITLQTATAGMTWSVSSDMVSDLRFNYSRTNSTSRTTMDDFGGGVPLTSLPFPPGFNAANGQLSMFWDSLGFAGPEPGFGGNNVQRQINVVENLALQKRSHNLKFGIDFRRLSPVFGNQGYSQTAEFSDVPTSTSGNIEFAAVGSGRGGAFLFHNLGAFAQDTWRVTPALTLTYGLRWDVDFAPSSNPSLLAVTGFSLGNLSNLVPAPAGTSPFRTTYGNVAPRVGVAYQLFGTHDRQTVLRGGFGAFYDLATSQAGNLINPFFYPFGASNLFSSGTFPFDATVSAPPPITIASLPTSRGYAFDPHLKLPYTLEWNVGLEQSLGAAQAITATYVGSAGKRLLQSAYLQSPNSNFHIIQLTTNASNSDYDALQLQFRRRLSRGFQAVASYTWSHSIDTASAGSVLGNVANALLPTAINQNRGPSDFDIRDTFSVGATYDVPVFQQNGLASKILRGWSLQNVFQVRSAPPVNVFDGAFFFLQNQLADIRPDVVVGKPPYLYGSQFPGRKALNAAAFVDPPLDSGGNPLRQGDLGRNSLRGFGAWQCDFAVHRDFPIHEALKLQFRAEMFNVLNHPNFAPPVSDLSNTTQFGQSTQTLGSFFASGAASSNAGSQAFSPLYQIGGPRSVQFGLKLLF